MESKASRHWVESTFEKLDREIREAKSQLAAQDEQFKGNMERITHDVETKLDRDEMETLRDYIGKASTVHQLRIYIHTYVRMYVALFVNYLYAERKLKDAKQPIIHQTIEPEGDDAAGFKK